MTVYEEAMDRDANRQVIQGNSAFKTKKSVTFIASGSGSVAAHTLFTVTGTVLVTVFGIINTTLNSDGAPTISIGTANNVAAIIGVTTAKNLADGDVWVDTTDSRVEVGAIPSAMVINDGADIIYNVLEATIKAGQVDVYCLWRPLSDGASLVAA